MTKRIIAIIAALLLALSLFACTEPEQTEETTTGNKIEIPTTAGETTADETESKEVETTVETNNNNGNNPGNFGYTDCNETVYVYIIYDEENKGGNSVTLRAADYTYVTTLTVGDKVTKIGVSDDADGYWSKVIVGDKTGYVASKFLTKINVLDPAGFDNVTKTVNINPLTGSLRVRDIPSMNSNIIGYVTAEKPVKVIGENTVDEWYKVEIVVEGKTVIGYIASNAEYFVQDKETTAETTEAATEEITTEAVVETEAESTTETMAPAGK